MKNSIRFKQFVLEFLKKNKGMFLFAVTTFFVSSVLDIFPAKIYQLIIDEGFAKKNINVVIVASITLFLLYIFKTTMNYISNHKLLVLGNKITSELKDVIFERLFSLELNFLSNYDTGYITSRLEEVAKIDTIFSNISINFVSSVAQSILALILIGTLSINFMFILLIPIPVLLFFMYKMAKNLNSVILKNVESGANYIGKMNETVSGIESIKSLGNERETQKKIIQYKDESLRNAKTQSIGLNKFSSALGIIGNIISVFIYLVGGILIIYDNLSIGSFIAISMYANRIYSPIISFSGVYMIWCPAIIGLRRVSDFFFDEKNIYVDDKKKDIDVINNINISNVSMLFGGNKVLENINLEINKGDRLQINGDNGSGKSTLIKMLLKSFRPSSGFIYVNGVDYNSISKSSIISKFAYVPQKQFVFNESAINNITLGLEDYDEEFLKVLIKEFGLEKIINSSNEVDFDSVGEFGKKISGGEIQKISICRAILRNKEIIIFDEATNNLDDKSINYLKKYITLSDKTWIIVDHQNDFSELGFKQVYI